VCFVEWSGPGSQRVVIDWTPIEDLGAAKQFGDQLLEIPRSFANSTSISGGIDFALAQFARAPFDAKRRTIDVSGNNNSGRDVRLARDEAVAAGVTVNGLVILTDERFSWSSEHTNPPGGLEKYYRDNVIGGADAFVLGREGLQFFWQSAHQKVDRRNCANRAARRNLAAIDRVGGEIQGLNSAGASTGGSIGSRSGPCVLVFAILGALDGRA
jgi:hypothetical protein